MRAICGNWRWWTVAGLVLILTAPAQAFYWHGWPGSQIRVEPSLVGPPVVTTPTVPPPPTTTPTVPPPYYPPPEPPVRIPPIPVGPPVPVDRTPVGPPTSTPEPTTGVLGLLGLGAIMAAKRWRAKH